MTEAQSCAKCGALVEPSAMAKHNWWHSDLEKTMRNVDLEASRAKRASR